jgi:hypothetical protein
LAYVGTLDFIESFDVEWIYSAHWPTFHRSQVGDFLTECRKFVDDASAIVWKTLEKHPEGVSLKGFIDESGPVLGNWPAANRWLLMYPMHGHLAYLELQGAVKKSKNKNGTVWTLTETAYQGDKIATA